MSEDGTERPVHDDSGHSVVVYGSMTGGCINTGDIVEGIRTLSPDYAGRVENFLITYLGTEGEPVPFGGRRKELDDLDRWLGDPHAVPYMLLAAPAGRGKSSLLAHWCQLLTAEQRQFNQIEIIYFPISIRFRTNLEMVVFTSLCARLAKLLGKDLTSTLGTSAEAWRGTFTEYLKSLPQGKCFLLVLDGVDEATDWEVGPDLFSFAPLPQLRVIVSARITAQAPSEEAWLQRLGWNHEGLARVLDLSSLDSAGVAEVLRNMGAPIDALSTKLDVVSELHRLSEGDPLLIGLYARELWSKGAEAARLQPEDLGAIPEGLSGYFQWWWKDQREAWGEAAPLREPSVKTVLNLLACALGPLTREDVLRVAPPDSGLDSRMLRDALAPLERMVIGDGRRQGYVFAHSRLAEFFWSEDSPEGLTKEEQMAWEERFLRYGNEVLTALDEGQLFPNDAPPYLIQYYGAHLERARAGVERLTPLLCEGWWQAWLALEGSYGGFLTDVDRVWTKAREHNRTLLQAGEKADQLHAEILCVLCHSSIVALAEKLPDELPAALVENELWSSSMAMAYVRRIHDPVAKTAALERLMDCVSEPQKARVLADALEAALRIADQTKRIEALSALAPHMPEPQKTEVLAEGLVVALRMRAGWDRMECLKVLAPHLPESVQVRAVEAALQEENLRERARILEALAPYLPPSLLAKALHAARRIEGLGIRRWILEALMPELPQPLITGALDAARGRGDAREKVELLKTLAPHLSEPQKETAWADALGEVQRMAEEFWRGEVLKEMAAHLPESLLTSAVDAAGKIEDDEVRTEVLVALVPRLSGPIKGEVLVEALALARHIGSGVEQARALSELALQLPEPQKESVLVKALSGARSIDDEDNRVWALQALAPNLSESLLNEACEAAKGIAAEEKRATLLRTLTKHVPEPKKKELLIQVLELTQRIGDEPDIAKALESLVQDLPAPQRNEVLTEALTAARRIRDEHSRAYRLQALASHLDEPGKTEVLHEALEAALAIALNQASVQWGGRRTFLLNELAPHLPRTLLTKAVEVAQCIDDDDNRASGLQALALHLPEPQRSILLEEAVQAALRIRYEETRAWTLLHLLSDLSQPRKADAISDILGTAQRIGDKRDRYTLLEALLPHVAEPQRAGVLADALVAARGVWDKRSRAWALAALVPREEEPQRSEILADALALTRSFENEEDRARCLTELAGYLSEPARAEMLAGALEAARRIETEWARIWALERLAPKLSEPLKSEVLNEALEAAKQLPDDNSRGRVLWELVRHLPEKMLLDAVANDIRGWPEHTNFIDVYTAVVSAMPLPELHAFWTERLKGLIGSGRVPMNSMRRLIIMAKRLGGNPAVHGIADAISTVSHWWP